MPDREGTQRLRRLLDAVVTVGADLDLPAMLRRIVQAAVDLVDARYGALGVLDEVGTSLAQFITVGLDDPEREAIGEPPKGHGILGLLVADARPLRLPDLTRHPDSFGFPPNHPPMRSFLGVPILLRDRAWGNLYLTDKTTAATFSGEDEELVVALAAAAGVAVENARLHQRVQELTLTEDRDRIARDLHDTVIQRLFSIGMSLQGAQQLARSPEIVRRVEAAVDDLDGTIGEIRTVVFGLEHRGPDGVRDRVLDIVREATQAIGLRPDVRFEGPVDTAVADDLADDAAAVVREALSNVTRHAHAHDVDVVVRADGDRLEIVVTDDGVGPPEPDTRRGQGLVNLRDRAERRGGTFEVAPAVPSGTVVRWSVPLGP